FCRPVKHWHGLSSDGLDGKSGPGEAGKKLAGSLKTFGQHNFQKGESMRIFIWCFVGLYTFALLSTAHDLATKKYPYTKERKAFVDVISMLVCFSFIVWALWLLVR